MTDTPGWAPPGSPESPHDTVGSSSPASPPVPPDTAQDTPPGAPQGVPQPAPQDTPPPAQGWGAPGPYSAAGYGGAPYGGPRGQHPAWGQQPAWGAPLTPKPGVIPLRPLGVGEILDGAMSTVRTHWRTALGLSFGIGAVEQTVSSLAQLWQYERPGDVLHAIAGFATYPVDILLGIIATGLLTIVVSKAILGENVTIGAAWASARPQLAKLTGLTFLTVLITAGIVLLAAVPLIAALVGGSPDFTLGLLLALPIFASLPVALWIGIQLSLATPALMLERQGVFSSMARSRRLVKGSWWRIFGISLLGQVLVSIMASIIALPFVLIGIVLAIGDTSGNAPFGSFASGAPPLVLLVTGIGGVIAATITIPVLSGINVLLYIDQRIRREALDIELARAAGLPEYGVADWAGSGPVIPGQSGPQGN